MTQALIVAAVALAEALERENAALQRLDLAAAAGLFGDKSRAMEAFVAAASEATAPAPAAARVVAVRLQAQAERNRSLLERAIAVQGRVIEAVVAAVPRPERHAATGGYSARGTPSRGARDAMALLARA